MKIIIVPITLPNKATVKLWVGEIPITRAEKTPIASDTPNPAGVIDTKPERTPKQVRNKAWEKFRFILKML